MIRYSNMSKHEQSSLDQLTAEGSKLQNKLIVQYLGGQGGDDGLCVNEGGVAQVVQAVRAEDGSSRLEPDWLLELDAAVASEQLWGHAAEGSEHGPPSVDQLELTVPALIGKQSQHWTDHSRVPC